jgi:hypothetical protein
MVFSFACLVRCKLAQLCLLPSSMNGIKHKKNTDTRKALAPKKCSGTRKVLTPEKCQHQSLHVPEDTAIHFTIVLDPPTAHLGPILCGTDTGPYMRSCLGAAIQTSWSPDESLYTLRSQSNPQRKEDGMEETRCRFCHCS